MFTSEDREHGKPELELKAALSNGRYEEEGFDRLKSASTYQGTGIGLAICKKIAENHGGSIVARSKLGKGSEFTVIIPAYSIGSLFICYCVPFYLKKR